MATGSYEVQNAPLVLSTKPTLPMLTFLPTRSGDGIKIIERIGAKFGTLGTLLLADDDGAKTEAIMVSHPHQPADITRGILSSWLNGGGRKPVTWNTFIAVLHQADLQELAQDIEKQISQGPTYDRKIDSNTVSNTSVEHSSPKLQDPRQSADFDADQSQRELVAANGSGSLSVIPASSSEEVKEMIEKLDKKFSNLKNSIRESLEKHKIFVKKVVDVLTSLSPDDDEHHKMFLESHVTALVTAADHLELFVKMNFHWNYLDPSLLDHLVRKLELNTMKAQTEAYKSDLQQFRKKTPLALFCQAHKRKRIELSPGFQEVVAEFSWPKDRDITLEVVEQFRQEYASHYKLYEFAMMLAKVRPGSFIITWFIPSSVTDKLMQNLPRDILRKYFITKVAIAGNCVHSINKEKNYISPSIDPEKGGPHTTSQISSTPGALDIADEATPSSFPQGYRALLMKMEIIEQKTQELQKETIKMKEILDSLETPGFISPSSDPVLAAPSLENQRPLPSKEPTITSTSQLICTASVAHPEDITAVDSHDPNTLISEIVGAAIEKEAGLLHLMVSRLQELISVMKSSLSVESSFISNTRQSKPSEPTEQALRKFHQRASDPSSSAVFSKSSVAVDALFTPTGQSVSMSILPRGNSYESMISCHPPHPQGTFHSGVKRPDELPDQKVDKAVIRDLSGELIGWVHPARHLGLDDSVIERIRIDYPRDVREQCYQMLKTWVQQHSPTATYQTLGHVLLTEATNVYPRYVEIVSRYCS